MSRYDVLIVGGGMVGASLALALRDLPLKVGLVEAVPFAAETQPSFDARAIALAQGSARIFRALGVWEAMAEEGATAIRHIHVSQRGGFGTTRLEADEEGVEALGYVVESRVLGAVLGPAVAALPQAELICPARVTGLSVGAESASVMIEQEGERRSLEAKLVVAADGGHSTVRELSGARSWRLGYGQSAVISTVATDRPHGNVAYERFTDTGPLALLPCDPPGGGAAGDEGTGGRRWSLVWSVRDAQVDELLGWDEATFLTRLQARFGFRAGRFERLGPRNAYPLGLQYVRDHVQPRLVFVGNAAHTIHPVAGQGFNLGLRDVAVLAEVLAGAAGGDPGGAERLAEYGRWRRGDYIRVMGMTDALARLFSNRLAPLALARGLGLGGMGVCRPARHLLARQAMGLTGALPRLACGIPLTPTN